MRNFTLYFVIILSLYFVIGAIADTIIETKKEEALLLPKSEKVIKDHSGRMQFRNIEQKEASQEYEKFIKFYPLYRYFGWTITYLLTLMCFGILGSAIRILIHLIYPNTTFDVNHIPKLLILGAIVGLCVIVVAEIIPEFKLKSGSKKFYYSLALISGIFVKLIFGWAEKSLNSFLKEKNKS